MKKTYVNPKIDLYNMSKKNEIIVTSGTPLANYGLGWFYLPTSSEDFKA